MKNCNLDIRRSLRKAPFVLVRLQPKPLCRRIGVTITNMKFQENPSGGNRAAPYEYTDRRTDGMGLVVAVREYKNEKYC